MRGTPGQAPVRYSNFGVGLLGMLLGRATGVGYEQALMTHVITPLGLGSTSFEDTPLHQGHHRGKPVAPWHLAAMAGAGGLRAPANDLLTLPGDRPRRRGATGGGDRGDAEAPVGAGPVGRGAGLVPAR